MDFYKNWSKLYTSATLWCNGSTNDFGSFSLGSNPGGVAIFVLNPAVKKETLSPKITFKESFWYRPKALKTYSEPGQFLRLDISEAETKLLKETFSFVFYDAVPEIRQ